jgi:hypothetical protein
MNLKSKLRNITNRTIQLFLKDRHTDTCPPIHIQTDRQKIFMPLFDIFQFTMFALLTPFMKDNLKSKLKNVMNTTQAAYTTNNAQRHVVR